MHVCAISDTHGLLPDIEPCDILLIAGDVTPIETHERRFQKQWLLGSFNQWLAEVPAKHIIGIAGNHDFILEEDEKLGYQLEWTYLVGEETEAEGLRIYGHPWVPNLPRWAFYKDDEDLKEAADKIPEGIDILVTHGPPKGWGDRVMYTKPGETSNHVGDSAITSAGYRIEPRLHVFGHIHEDRGDWTLDFPESSLRTLANVSMRDEMYQAVGRKPMEWHLANHELSP